MLLLKMTQVLSMPRIIFHGLPSHSVKNLGDANCLYLGNVFLYLKNYIYIRRGF